MGFHTHPRAIIGLNRLHKIKETPLNHGKKIKTESGHLRALFVGKNFDITQSEAA
eukprot:NODE_7928_length_181_cov_0.765152_g7257_i0.p1 GENE.NODE_7928_length_181_cov_0.765152_g7257_i0~~NODE_7928_length_181_cov_0.765152_g7257_i0.p1  ORF type:complete len:55 (-),score=1.76 NODE_7928_length_181_cov_0.765152_g7257_i0:11-175(-)